MNCIAAGLRCTKATWDEKSSTYVLQNNLSGVVVRFPVKFKHKPVRFRSYNMKYDSHERWLFGNYHGSKGDRFPCWFLGTSLVLWIVNNVAHRLDGPAETGFLAASWIQYGMHHRTDARGAHQLIRWGPTNQYKFVKKPCARWYGMWRFHAKAP